MADYEVSDTAFGKAERGGGPGGFGGFIALFCCC